MAKKTSGNKLAVGCLALFALPFAAIGAGMTVLVVQNLWAWRQVQSWVETPAALLTAELKTETDDDGTVYRVVARYSYDFAGKHYESTRVAIHGGADNIGGYNQQRGRELEAVQKAGQPYRCFVNPDRPSEAILFRDLRPGMLAFELLFGMVFGGVGFGLLVGIWWGVRVARRTEALKQKWPNQPWMWREDWAAGHIRSSGAGVAWFLTFFAIVWNAVTWPIFFMVRQRGTDPDAPPIWLLGLFPAVGLLVALSAVYMWMRRIRWGVSELELSAVPGVLGGPLAGLVHVPHAIAARDGYFVRLACVRTTRVQMGDRTETNEDVVWEKEKRIVRDLAAGAGGKTIIPVEFTIPYDLPPTEGDDVTWRVEARAETRGVDYFCQFDVPVFLTSQSSPTVKGDADSPEALDPEEAALDFKTVVQRMGARIERESTTSRTLLFPAARNRRMAITTAVFAVLWTAGTIVAYQSSASRWVWRVLAGIDLLSLASVAMTCLMRTELEFGASGVATDWRILGLGRRRSLLPGEITKISADRSGTKSGSTYFQQVVAELAEKKKCMLVSEIARPGDAERLAQEIREAVGLSKKRKAGGSSRMALESELPPDLRGE